MKPKVDLPFRQLTDSLTRFGLDPDLADSVPDAARMLRAKWRADGLTLDWECPGCGLSIPDFDSCPFCGAEFKTPEPSDAAPYERRAKGIPARLYRGARRGRVARGEERPKGTTLFAALIRSLGIPDKFVKVRGKSVGLWCNWGCFARCAIGVASVRLYLPFGREHYDKAYPILVNLLREYKYQKSRVFLDHESSIPEVLEILAQTIALKKDLRESKQRSKETNENLEDETGVNNSGKRNQGTRGRSGKRNRAGSRGPRGRSGGSIS